MKKSLALLCGIGLAVSALGQNEMSSFTSTGRGGATTFATDYQALGINPANLGWTWKFEGKSVALGMNEVTYSIHSSALEKTEVRESLKGIFRSMIGKESEPFTRDQKVDLAKDFAEDGFAFNVDYGAFGIAYSNEAFGGIAFGISDRFQWYSTFNPDIAELLFLGFEASYFDSLNVMGPMGDTLTVPNDGTHDPDSIINGFANIPQMFSQLFNGSEISFSWTREYNLSYGRKLLGDDEKFALYGGVGIKYMQGLAMIQATSDGSNLEAFSAITPFFDIDYGSASVGNPSNVDQGGGFLPKSVGSGWGFDLGANAVIGGKLKIGAAVTNIGSITWDGNVYSASDTLLYDSESGGLNSWDVKEQFESFVGENGLFKWDGLQERKVKLPTTMRLGASYVINEKIEIGADMIMPFNEEPGNYEKAVIALGGDIQPIPWLRLSGGFVTGGNYKFQIPVGILFIAGGGTWEAGVASRDAISFFVSNGPTLSLSTGFMRFRF